MTFSPTTTRCLASAIALIVVFCQLLGCTAQQPKGPSPWVIQAYESRWEDALNGKYQPKVYFKGIHAITVVKDQDGKPRIVRSGLDKFSAKQLGAKNDIAGFEAGLAAQREYAAQVTNDSMRTIRSDLGPHADEYIKTLWPQSDIYQALCRLEDEVEPMRQAYSFGHAYYLALNAHAQEVTKGNYGTIETGQVSLAISSIASEMRGLPTVSFVVTNLTKDRLIYPWTYEALAYTDNSGRERFGRVPRGFKIHDNAGNDLGIDDVIDGGSTKGRLSIQPGSTMKLSFRIQHVPPEQAKDVIIQIDKDTVGNQNPLIIKLPAKLLRLPRL